MHLTHLIKSYLSHLFSLQNNPISKVCQLTNHLLVSADLIRVHSLAATFTSHPHHPLHPLHHLHRHLFTSSSPHHFQTSSSMSSTPKMTENGPVKCSKSAFTPKKALVLGKFSRYEFEKHRNPNLSEKEISDSVSCVLIFLQKTNIFLYS